MIHVAFLLALVAAPQLSTAAIELAPGREVPLISSSWEVWPETGTAIPFETARANPDRFEPASSLTPTGAVVERYWGRLTLRSVAEHREQWVIPLGLRDVEAFVVRADGRVERQQTGHAVAARERSFRMTPTSALLVALDAGETATLYLHVRENTRSYGREGESPPKVLRAYLEQYRAREAYSLLAIGALLVLAIYNLFLYASLRDRSYCYYVGFLVGTAVFWGASSDFAGQYLPIPGWMGAPEWGFGGLVFSTMSYGLFVRNFLCTPQHSRLFDRLLVGVIVLWGGIGALAAMTLWGIAETMAASTALVSLVIALGAGLQVMRQGFYPARQYLIASSPLVFVGVVYVVVFFLAPEQMATMATWLQTATLVEVVMLAHALSVRIRVLSDERADALTARQVTEERNAALKAANDLKTRLIGIAAHDLRSPLGTVVGYADMIEFETPGQADLHQLTGAIHRSSTRMLRLIEDLLMMSAVENGELALSTSRVDLVDTVRESASTFAAHAEAKGQTLTVEGEATFAFADPERIAAVVDNLLSNAIKYSALDSPVGIRVGTEGSWAVLRVSDSGPGFSDEDREQLFQPFTRLAAQPTAGESSTGLGLSIVKQIVDLHGGEIAVESESGHGATFVVRLPAAEPPSPGAIIIRPCPAKDRRRGHERCRTDSEVASSTDPVVPEPA